MEQDNNIEKQKISDFNSLLKYIEKEYSKYNINVINNFIDDFNWEIQLIEKSSNEENIIIKNSFNYGIIIFYPCMHWHIDKDEFSDLDNFNEIIDTIDSIIKDGEYIYTYYRDKNFSDRTQTGSTKIKDDVFLRKILTHCEMPFKKKIKSIRIKQWNKKEMIFIRLDNNFWEEVK